MTAAALHVIEVPLPLLRQRRSQRRAFVLDLLLRLRRAASAAGLALVLAASAFALEATLERVPPAHAQNVPEGLNKLEEKLNDVQALIRRVLYVFVGIGIAFCGFRFVQGDPHAWKFTMMVVVGATIVFASGEILTWLER